jgi:hypothetical protein
MNPHARRNEKVPGGVLLRLILTNSRIEEID